VISRLELRWDHDLNGNDAFSDEDDNAWLVAANFIYRF